VSEPRAIVGSQADGDTPDTVTVEAELCDQGRDALRSSGLAVREVPQHTESMGQSNVVFIAGDDMAAASDPRSDGAGMVAHFPRRPRRWATP
jgi:gamma-glutamyltranspeptidase/glutathione hydrolase